MLNKIYKNIYSRVRFRPTLLSVFIHPLYFIRKGIYKGVKSNAKYMNGILLDFGCGSKPYKQLLSVQEYVGLDIEKSGHEHSDEVIECFYDGHSIPFKDNYFDSGFSSEVLEHIFNIDEILDELYRVLKPGANLLITLPFVWEEHEIPFDYCRYTSFGIKYLVEKHGFKIINQTQTTSYIETIFQLWTNYMSKYLLPKNKLIKAILMVSLISPFTITGIILSMLLPNKNTLYLNNVIVAKKL